jgi:hypothetical protein
MKMLKPFLVFVSLFSLGTAHGQSDSKSKFTVEPIYGIETALVQYPGPARYKTRATYGARALYGVTLLSGELEYTTSTSRDDYPALDQVVTDKVERANLGLRSTISIGKYIGFYFRAGGSASQGKTTIKTAGVEETKDRALTINPYGGAGLQVAFASNLAINAGVTMIRNSESEYDAQYTLGLSARFGTVR